LNALYAQMKPILIVGIVVDVATIMNVIIVNGKDKMKYNPITALQSAVALEDVSVEDIFSAAAVITRPQTAACTPLELLRYLYTQNGDENLTVTQTARELGVARSGIYNRRAWIMRRLRWILTHEEDNDV